MELIFPTVDLIGLCFVLVSGKMLITHPCFISPTIPPYPVGWEWTRSWEGR